MDRRDFLRAGAVAALPAADMLPNFVLMLADDLGYGDLSCYGHPTIATPNLDAMAREGMRFTQFYAAAPMCGPSRAALMTGRLAIRSGMTRNLFPWSQGGLPDSEITIAAALKKAGYATMCVGKWHLGHLPPYLPPSRGFDDYFGIPYSNDMSKASNPRAPWADKTPPTPLIRGEKIIEQEPDQSRLTARHTEAACEFIRRSARAGKPFFLYLPYTAPHWPLSAGERFRGRSLAGLYGDVVEEIDWSAGEILRVLREENADRNTLAIFTSDNGAESGSPGPFRDGKVTTWEGGLREPCIVRWPGKIPAGVVSRAFGTAMDFFPTFAGLARREMPRDRVYDGEDLAPVLLHNDPGREPLMFYYSDENVQAVRKGRWKLHSSVNNRKTPPPPGEGDPPLLFDVQQDISERRNVARRQPEVVKELLALVERHKTSIAPVTTQQ
jgi:arylsulfatase A-like enzyme